MHEPAVTIPSLPTLDREVLDRLPVDALIDLRAQLDHHCADVDAAVARRVAQHSVSAGAALDRALGIDEAAAMLGMSKDFVYRRWPKLGGFKDDDGHVKFALSIVQRHIRMRAAR
jgi:hypothetical protein